MMAAVCVAGYNSDDNEDFFRAPSGIAAALTVGDCRG